MIAIPELLSFDATCTVIGVETPRPVVKALELHNAAYEALTPAPRALLDLSTDDLGDVLADLAVRQHTGIAMDTIGFLAGMPVFERQLLAEVQAATEPLLDDLIRQVQARFEEGVQPIVEAVQRSFTGHTSAAQVLERRNQEDADAFMAARDAIAALQPLVSFRQAISRVFTVAPTGPIVDYSACFAAGDNWGSDGEYNRERKHPGVVDLVAIAAGGLHLNTISEVEAKLIARRAEQFAHLTTTTAEEA